MRTMIGIILLVIMITGCSSKDKLITEMKSHREGAYSVFVYFGEIPSEPDKREAVKDPELLKQFEVYDSLNKKIRVDKHKIDRLSIQTTTSEHIQVFDITEFPTFIVLDNKGIVLQTTQIDDVEKLLNQ